MRTHPECRDEVHSIFNDFYLGYDLVVSGPLSGSLSGSLSGPLSNPLSSALSGPLSEYDKTAIQVLHEDDIIKVANSNLVEDFLDTFGRDIYSIIVDFQEIGVIEGKEIVEYINDECYETLEKIRLLNCKGDVLDRLKNEFKKIKVVRFSSSVSEDLTFDTHGHRMQNIFPTLSVLRVYHTTPSDWTFINGKFPHLKAFEVHLPQTIQNDTINSWHISSFLMNNKKIRDLTIVHPTLKLLKVVNEKLDQLERLGIVGLSGSYLNILNKPFQFRQLKHLMLCPNLENEGSNLRTTFRITENESSTKTKQPRYRGQNNEIPWKIYFPSLDRLSLRIKHNLTSEWMRFISKKIDSDLSELKIKTQELARGYFQAIPGIFPQLTEVHILCQSRFTASDVLTFMKDSKSLTSLKLEISIDGLEYKRLFKRLDKMWTSKRYNLSEYHGTVFMTFRRYYELLSNQNFRSENKLITIFFVRDKTLLDSTNVARPTGLNSSAELLKMNYSMKMLAVLILMIVKFV